MEIPVAVGMPVGVERLDVVESRGRPMVASHHTVAFRHTVAVGNHRVQNEVAPAPQQQSRDTALLVGSLSARFGSASTGQKGHRVLLVLVASHIELRRQQGCNIGFRYCMWAAVDGSRRQSRLPNKNVSIFVFASPLPLLLPLLRV